ncbi:sugar phosphate isomerase/epimerase family protein [Streptomyces sp. G45]|uniref:sugar phosphate isomerase/epimerase family protein n=1 Tax=Streptomyces sp. G45 TaxID=3406627 RepID=UPI003C1D7151
MSGVPGTDEILVCGIGDEAATGLADQIRVHTDLGLTGIELRTVDGRGAHQWSLAEAERIATAVAEAGLAVPVVDTPIGGWAVTVADDFAYEEKVLRRAAAHAGLLGCHRLRVMSYPSDGRPDALWRAAALRRMRELALRARDLGMVLLHENCHGWASQSAAHTLELLGEVDGVRLVFDVGNGLAYGYDAVAFLAEVLPYVDHVHIKDGTRATGGAGAVFGLPGDGEADVATCLRMLRGFGYHGWYSLEPHVAHIPHLNVSGDPARLEAGYRACAERFAALVRDELGARTAADAADRPEARHG